MGVIATAGGIGGGILVAKGIDALFAATGVDLVEYPLVLATRTWSSPPSRRRGHDARRTGPARRAATIPPSPPWPASARAAPPTLVGAGSGVRP